MRCWPQAGAKPELLGSGGSVRQLCPSRLHLPAKDFGRVGHVKRRAKRGCVAHSMECKHEHCREVACVSRGCHTKSLDVANTEKNPLCCSVLLPGTLPEESPPSPPLSPVGPRPGRRGLARSFGGPRVKLWGRIRSCMLSLWMG